MIITQKVSNKKTFFKRKIYNKLIILNKILSYHILTFFNIDFSILNLVKHFTFTELMDNSIFVQQNLTSINNILDKSSIKKIFNKAQSSKLKSRIHNIYNMYNI